MSYRVRIEQFDREVDVEPEQTILECALLEGIDYPFACQQGQCGSCKSQLISGEVFMPSGYNPLALPGSEFSRGMILACQAHPRADCVVSVVSIGGRIVHPVRALRCSVTEVLPAGRHAQVVRLRADAGGPFNFEAGQFAWVSFAGGPERAAAMASRPTEAMIEFHVPDRAIEPGDRATVRGPYGEAYLHDEHIGPILALGEGVGLAPMLSIVEQALAIGMPQRIYLIVGASAAADLYYLDRLAALAARNSNLRVVTLTGAPDLGGHVAQAFTDLAAFRVYAAGPAASCASWHELAIARGLPSEHWAACVPEALDG